MKQFKVQIHYTGRHGSRVNTFIAEPGTLEDATREACEAMVRFRADGRTIEGFSILPLGEYRV